MEYIANGNPFGSHRVIEPKGVLPQPALRIDNDLSRLWDNEMLIEVETLNIDAASFSQIKQAAGGDEGRIRETIQSIVIHRGKLQNPVTGSGGMLVGTVAAMGPRWRGRADVGIGDRIASLVSLSLTPLRIDAILEVKSQIDQVRIRGQAVLFESGIYIRLPADLPPALALALLDVAGAPAQTARLVRPGDTVVIIGATGKSGILCAYEARKRAGVTGNIIGTGTSDRSLSRLAALGFCDHAVKLDATDALGVYETVKKLTAGQMADLVINCVNVPNTEMASILACRERGTVYFFSMATSFTQAALGAEGVGRDITMIIGNGYTRDHAVITLNLLRESEPIRQLYQTLYA